MSSEYPSDEKIREWTRQLVDALEREHPEMEYEPVGLRLPPEPPVTTQTMIEERLPSRKRRRSAAAPPGFPTFGKAWPILKQIADEHDLDAADILSDRRFHRLVRARRAAFAALVQAGYSLSATGRLMRRDHTTVLYGMRKVREASREAGVL